MTEPLELRYKYQILLPIDDKEEIKLWVRENLTQYVLTDFHSNPILYLNSDEDALLYKMTWS